MTLPDQSDSATCAECGNPQTDPSSGLCERCLFGPLPHHEPPRDRAIRTVAEALAVHGNAYRDPEGPQFDGGEEDYWMEQAEAVVRALQREGWQP